MHSQFRISQVFSQPHCGGGEWPGGVAPTRAGLRFSHISKLPHRDTSISLAASAQENAHGLRVTGQMAKAFDAAAKELLQIDPRAWLKLLLDRDVGEVRMLNVDLSAISAEADSVLLVELAEPWVVHEATRSQAQTLWMATYLLMGLNYPDELVDRLLEGVQNMKESATYQKILREGRVEGRVEGLVEGERRILRRLGTRQFGKPDPLIDAALDAITDLDRLEQLSVRVLEVKTWEELLAQP